MDLGDNERVVHFGTSRKIENTLSRLPSAKKRADESLVTVDDFMLPNMPKNSVPQPKELDGISETFLGVVQTAMNVCAHEVRPRIAKGADDNNGAALDSDFMHQKISALKSKHYVSHMAERESNLKAYRRLPTSRLSKEIEGKATSRYLLPRRTKEKSSDTAIHSQPHRKSKKADGKASTEVRDVKKSKGNASSKLISEPDDAPVQAAPLLKNGRRKIKRIFGVDQALENSRKDPMLYPCDANIVTPRKDPPVEAALTSPMSLFKHHPPSLPKRSMVAEHIIHRQYTASTESASRSTTKSDSSPLKQPDGVGVSAALSQCTHGQETENSTVRSVTFSAQEIIDMNYLRDLRNSSMSRNSAITENTSSMSIRHTTTVPFNEGEQNLQSSQVLTTVFTPVLTCTDLYLLLLTIDHLVIRRQNVLCRWGPR